MTCRHCGAKIFFNAAIRKWVTEKDHWHCGNDPQHPVKAHTPESVT